MKKIVTLTFAAFILVSCQHKTKVVTDDRIRVADAFRNPEQPKASDWFKDIDYIALETTDESLIGEGAEIQVTDKYIVVTTVQKQCLVFERQTGQFVRSLGHVGNDPGGYSNANGIIDYKTNRIYFPGWDRNRLCYDLDGNYLRDTKLFPGAESSTPIMYPLDNDTFVSYFFNMTGDESKRLYFYNADGDSLRLIPNEKQLPPFTITMISVFRPDASRQSESIIVNKGEIIFESDDQNIGNILMMEMKKFWQTGNNYYFKEEYNDTIFQLNNFALEPYLVFDLEDYHWPYEERYMKNRDKNIYIQQILEGKDQLLFRFNTHRFTADKRKEYYGLYNKATGKVIVSGQDKGIIDDIRKGPALHPVSVNPSGTFAAILPAYALVDWIEENPGKNIPAFKNINEEDNPVIAILK